MALIAKGDKSVVIDRFILIDKGCGDTRPAPYSNGDSQDTSYSIHSRRGQHNLDTRFIRTPNYTKTQLHEDPTADLTIV